MTFLSYRKSKPAYVLSYYNDLLVMHNDHKAHYICAVLKGIGAMQLKSGILLRLQYFEIFNNTDLENISITLYKSKPFPKVL